MGINHEASRVLLDVSMLRDRIANSSGTGTHEHLCYCVPVIPVVGAARPRQLTYCALNVGVQGMQQPHGIEVHGRCPRWCLIYMISVKHQSRKRRQLSIEQYDTQMSPVSRFPYQASMTMASKQLVFVWWGVGTLGAKVTQMVPVKG